MGDGDDLEFILGLINNAICHTFESLKSSELKRPSYSRDRAKAEENILRVASFEMVLDVSQLKGHNIIFRENMGVASTIINLGEESLPIADILRTGGDVIHHSISVNIHPEVSTGTIFNN